MAPLAQSSTTRRPASAPPKRSQTRSTYLFASPISSSHRAGGRVGGRVEQGLDGLLLNVLELPAAAEELDAVVLGRVVRGGHDCTSVLGEQGDRGGRQHAAENHVGPAVRQARRKRLFEGWARVARVAADKGLGTTAPAGERATEPLDELRGQALADDTPNAVGPEQAPAHQCLPGTWAYRLENCGALRALWSPAFLRSTMRASRVRKPSRLSTPRSSGSASTSARAIP